MVSKVFKNLVNNRLVDFLEKYGLFSDFQFGFRSSRSTADLLTVVCDTITRSFNKSGTSPAVAIDISKTFGRIWYTGLLHNLKSYGISSQIFGLISSFLSNKQIQVVLFFFFFFNWDLLHARLNSHYEACSYKKRSTIKITGYRKSV